MYAREQYERELEDGRPSWELALERTLEIREHCMSGEVMTEPTVGIENDLRHFVAMHIEHRKDAEKVAKYLEANAGTDVFVRLDGDIYALTKNYGGSWELPVNIRKAKVIEG